MKAGLVTFSLAITGMLSVVAIEPAFAQSAPTQAAIADALRPIPEALRCCTSGLEIREVERPAITVFGSAPRRNRNIVKHDPVVTPEARANLPGCLVPASKTNKPGASFSTITFEFGSAQLKPETLDTLRNLGKALNQDLGDQQLFVIEGHTDAVGTIAYNEELSKLRAEAVKDFLVNEMGVASERLDVVGKAYCDPANPQDPRGAVNRRVVVINQSG